MTDTAFRPSFSHFGGPEIAMMERFTGGQAVQSLLELSGIYEAIEKADKPVDVVENAAGAGVLTSALKAKVKGEGKVKIVMGDVEEKMVQLAKQRREVEEWKDVEVKVMDGMVRSPAPFLRSLAYSVVYSFRSQNVPLPDNSFDFAFIHFGLQLFPDAAKGISGPSPFPPLSLTSRAHSHAAQNVTASSALPACSATPSGIPPASSPSSNAPTRPSACLPPSRIPSHPSQPSPPPSPTTASSTRAPRLSKSQHISSRRTSSSR